MKSLLLVVLLVGEPSLWDTPLSPIAEKLSLASRCLLASRVMAYRMEREPGKTRVPFSEEGAVRRLALWRGRPLMCGAVMDKHRAPLFAKGESCDGDVAIYTSEIAGASDLPEGCAYLDLTRRKDGSFSYRLIVGGLKRPFGVGTLPSEGIVKRSGDEWIAAPFPRGSRKVRGRR